MFWRDSVIYSSLAAKHMLAVTDLKFISVLLKRIRTQISFFKMSWVYLPCSSEIRIYFVVIFYIFETKEILFMTAMPVVLMPDWILGQKLVHNWLSPPHLLRKYVFSCWNANSMAIFLPHYRVAHANLTIQWYSNSQISLSNPVYTEVLFEIFWCSLDTLLE